MRPELNYPSKNSPFVTILPYGSLNRFPVDRPIHEEASIPLHHFSKWYLGGPQEPKNDAIRANLFFNKNIPGGIAFGKNRAAP
jgi:hypothetical protein